MNWQKVNWSIIVIGILISFTAASSSYYFWQQYVVTKPLTQTIQEIDGVEQVTLDAPDKKQGIREVHVTLANVDNLQTTYQLINDTIEANLGTKKFKLILRDHRTPELEQLYYSLHYHIYEGIFTGKFGTMSEIIQEKAAAANTQAQVYMDANYVYLQLTTTTGNLYQVFPRQPDSKEVK
jgi:NACalpha-BTF3-like transcription factor